jgi:hypothetical protein
LRGSESTITRQSASPAFLLELPRTGRWRMTTRPPGKSPIPVPPIPVWPGTAAAGEGIPDSRLGRNRESGNPPLPDSAGTGNRGPGTGHRGPAGGAPGISWSGTRDPSRGIPEIGNPGLAGMGGFGVPEISIRPVSGESAPMPGRRGFRGLPSGSSGQCRSSLTDTEAQTRQMTGVRDYVRVTCVAIEHE